MVVWIPGFSLDWMTRFSSIHTWKAYYRMHEDKLLVKDKREAITCYYNRSNANRTEIAVVGYDSVYGLPSKTI